ncbi:MAG: hypothetical protein ACR2NR_02800 [Solirubrobacteraceae bacterium]
MISAGEVQEIEAEVNHFRDRVALLRVRLYRRGIATSERLQELQRNLESAQRRLGEARATRTR